MMSEEATTGYVAFVWLMKLKEKRLARRECSKQARSARLPKIDLINPWLLGEKCKPIIVRDADKAFNTLLQGWLSNFCIKVPSHSLLRSPMKNERNCLPRPSAASG